ncbi:MAG: YHS domain-containing protein [Desulfobacterales bacterium]
MRLLILLGLLYLGYRFLKSWMFKETPAQTAASENKTAEINNIMVKDPHCGVYFSKKDGVHLNMNGQDLYFCSEECKDKFLEKQAKG